MSPRAVSDMRAPLRRQARSESESAAAAQRWPASATSFRRRTPRGRLAPPRLVSTHELPLRLMNQHDDEHSPNGQQRVADRIRDRITETWNLARRGIGQHAKRRCRLARTGDRAECDRRVEPEDVFGDEDAEYDRHRRG